MRVLVRTTNSGPSFRVWGVLVQTQKMSLSNPPVADQVCVGWTRGASLFRPVLRQKRNFSHQQKELGF